MRNAEDSPDYDAMRLINAMDGCPEIEPSDLLSVRALDDIEKKFDEYRDLSVARKRVPKPFAAVFVKHSAEISMKFNNLLKKKNTLAMQL